MLLLPYGEAMHHNLVAPTFSFVRRSSTAMARGWESKSVEEQQSQSATAGKSSENKNSKPAAEQANARKHEALQLARARLQQQLEACTNDRYAEQLRQALAAIDKQLAQG